VAAVPPGRLDLAGIDVADYLHLDTGYPSRPFDGHRRQRTG
jgi:hypothetical protein